MDQKLLVPRLVGNQLPSPTDWAAIFEHPDRPRPLILEIGFGMGQYLRHLSAQRPYADILGLEIVSLCLNKAEGAIARGELPNVRVVYVTGETALAHLIAPESLDEVHINFPDPWFKSRHHHRRLMTTRTAQTIADRLKPNGTLYVATDIREYAELTDEILRETPGLRNRFSTPWVTEMPGRTVTKYEAKAIAEGRTCHYFAYDRDGSPTPDMPLIKDAHMPHLIVNTPLSLDDMRERFDGHDVSQMTKQGVVNVSFKYIYRGPNSLLFEVYVAEPTIEQYSAVLMVRDGDTNDYTVRLSQMGSPRPTDGMHVAVTHVGEWVASLHPDAQVVTSKTRTFD